MGSNEIRNFSAQTPKRNSDSILFCIGFIVLYIKIFLDSTRLINIPELFGRILLVVGAVFLLLHIARNLKKYEGAAGILLVVIAFGVWLYYQTQQTAPSTAILVVIAAATTKDPKWLVRFWLSITAFLVAFLCIAYIVSAITDPERLVLIYRKDDGVVGTTRYAFFFTHPNSAAAIAMMMICAYLYLRKKRITFVTMTVLALASAAVFYFTDSRTSFILSLLAIIMFYAQQHTGFLSGKKVKSCLGVLPVILFVATYLIAGPLYSSDLGSMFTGRVWLWHTYDSSQGLTVLGRVFEESYGINLNGYAGSVSTLDSFYANGLYVYGLVYSVLFSYAYYTTVKTEQDKYSQAYPLLLIMALWGFTEGKMIVLLFAPGLFLLCNCISTIVTKR